METDRLGYSQPFPYTKLLRCIRKDRLATWAVFCVILGPVKTITLRTKPVPINQKYGIMNGRNLLTRKYRDAKEALQWEAQTQWNGQPLEDDLIVHVQFYFGDRRRRDIDAYLKILLDAMEGVVYQDDAQVMELHVFKHVDTNDPKTVVQVL